MAINPNISLAVRGVELQDPLAQYSKFAAIQGAQQQNQLAQMQMQEYERTRAEEEGLRNYLAQSDLAKPETRAGLMRYGKTGLAYGTALSAQDKAALERQEAQIKVQKGKQDFMSQALRDISRNPSDANITAYLEDLGANPLFSPEEKANVRSTASRILSMPVDQRGAFMASQGATSAELKSTISVGPTGIVQTPAFAGAATVVPGTEAAFKMTPAQVEANKIAQQRVGIEGQRVGLESQRVGLESQRVDLAKKESERKTQGLEALPPKEIQKREAALPQATSAIKGFETKSESFISDLEKLRDDPGLNQITGAVYGRTPSISREGSRAQALYDKIVAKGGFQALQDMRDASKTGGALGNVSNQEGKQLQASVAAIDRRQNPEDVKAAINQLINDIQGSKARMREAYDATYSYRTPIEPANAAADPLGIRK